MTRKHLLISNMFKFFRLLRRCLCALLSRVRELLAAKMVVDKFLPFSFFSGSWEELMGTVTAEGGCTPFPPLTSKRVKHLVVEMFVATKKVGGALPPVSCRPLFCFRPSFASRIC